MLRTFYSRNEVKGEQCPKTGTRHIAIPRCIQLPKFEFPPQIMYELCSGHDYPRNEVKDQGQGNSDQKCERPSVTQDASKHLIWDANLKKCSRYAPDTIFL